MRANVRAFVAEAVAAFEPAGPVYEFGSFQVPGQEAESDLRPLFAGRRYTGCDLRPGPGVDRVEDLAALTLPDAAAGTVLCVETLEHTFEIRRAVDELLRVLRPGGMLLVTTPLDFRIHNYPADYWRLTPACLARLFEPLAAWLVGWQGLESFPHTVFGLGFKAPAPVDFLARQARLEAGFQRWLRQAAARVPWRRRLKQQLTAPLRGKGERRRQRAEFQVGFVTYARDEFATDHPWLRAMADEPRRAVHRGAHAHAD